MDNKAKSRGVFDQMINAASSRDEKAAALEAAKAQVIATHTLIAEETLSHLALKYYGHATEPY